MPRSILIIDDDPSILRFLKLHLQKAGYAVFEAPGPIPAMDVLWKEKIDLVVTDMRMPGMDGYEVVASLRRKYPKMPLVVVSADAKNDRLHNALRYSDVTFVPKPFEIADLLRIISEQLSNSGGTVPPP